GERPHLGPLRRQPERRRGGRSPLRRVRRAARGDRGRRPRLPLRARRRGAHPARGARSLSPASAAASATGPAATATRTSAAPQPAAWRVVLFAAAVPLLLRLVRVDRLGAWIEP